ncbi:MAG: NAD-dependent epimerase/dehydratase family protein [Acidobacteriota bacterium]
MQILFTGASSATGREVLKQILESVDDVEVWCSRHQGEVAISDSRVRVFDLDLAEHLEADSLPETIDLVIHFAGVTHAHDAESYWNANFRGTKRLAEAARARKCSGFVYISTRCAVPGAGAYGESKLAAEDELHKLPWDSLLIIRPSEIYGGGGKEGVDKIIAVARRWHLTPLLFGNSNISFAPLWFDDFAAAAADEIIKANEGSRTIELCGPEDISAATLAKRIAKRYRALPIPVWWPLFALALKIGTRLNLNLAAPDQLARLTCVKTGSAMHADRRGSRRFLIDTHAFGGPNKD